MSYREFNLAKVKTTFNLTTSEKSQLFAKLPEVAPSKYLCETLDYNVPLALASNSEKARSEMIITPILIEVKKQLESQVSLFSGVDFNVDQELGLNGFCDFILSSSSEQLFITAPVLVLVEAKKEDLISGIGQCIAEMYAAQLFNQEQNQNISKIMGAVTSGTNWRFMALKENLVEIDLTEYYLDSLPKILGILINSISN